MEIDFTQKKLTLLNELVQAINQARKTSGHDLPFNIASALADHPEIMHNEWFSNLDEIIQHAQTNLFCYGSLQPGGQNEHILKVIDGAWYEGFVFGDIQPGTGEAVGFPVLIPDYCNNNSRISGKLFRSRDLINFWNILDEFEGEEYMRLLVVVHLAYNDQLTVASVYAGKTSLIVSSAENRSSVSTC